MAIPSITSISPASGLAGNSTDVIITGANFAIVGFFNVTIGGVACTSISIQNSTSVNCFTPSSSAGSYPVVISNNNGTSNQNINFNFVASLPPTITSISPHSGSTTGGTSVEIGGSNFVSGTTVTFGSNSATNVSIINTTLLSCNTPSHAVGVVNVSVTVPAGTATLTNGYTYNIPITNGSISFTEPTDTVTINAHLTTSGILTFTEPGDTASVNGSIGWRGTLAYTEVPDTVSFNGLIGWTGTLSYTESPDTISYSGTNAVSGTISYREPTDTFTINAHLTTSGTFSLTENPDTIMITGGSGYTGTINFTEPPDVFFYIDPDVPLSGTINFTEPPDYIYLGATITSSGILSFTEAPDGFQYSGTIVIPSNRVSTFYLEIIAAPISYTSEGPFPIVPPVEPLGPTGLTSSIKSYLYQEYSDDDDLQAFVAAYNTMQQNVVDSYNSLNLPIYQNDPINGVGIDKNGNPTVTWGLLDWVGQGVYGYPRPSVSAGFYIDLGPYNTAMYNLIQYNEFIRVFPQNQIIYEDDDFYRRCLTWHLSKREGKYFTIEWLKKRIMKFIYGINGTQPFISQTGQISITFGTNNEVTIRFVLGIRSISGSALYNDNLFQYNVMMYNEVDTSYIMLPDLPYTQQFSAAVRSGVLELPFQYKFDVVIG